LAEVTTPRRHGAGTAEATAKSALAKAAAPLRHSAGTTSAAAKSALAEATTTLRHSAGTAEAAAKTALAGARPTHRHSARRSKAAAISGHSALLTEATAEALLAEAATEPTLAEAALSRGHAALPAETAAKFATTKTTWAGTGRAPTATRAATAPRWLVVTPTATFPRRLSAAWAAPAAAERLAGSGKTAAPRRGIAPCNSRPTPACRPAPFDLADDLIRGHGRGAVVAISQLSQRRQSRPPNGHKGRARTIAHHVVPIGHLFAQYFDPGFQRYIRLGRRSFTLAALFLRRLFLVALAGGLRPCHGNRQQHCRQCRGASPHRHSATHNTILSAKWSPQARKRLSADKVCSGRSRPQSPVHADYPV
jgi:hypothetical protein